MEVKSGKITIKLNGEDSSIGSTQDDYSQLYTKESAATTEKKNDDEFDWIIPEIEKNIQEPVVYPLGKNKSKKEKRKNRKRRLLSSPNYPYMRRILFIAIFAVIVGTGLGLGILKIVSTNLLTEGEMGKKQEIHQNPSEPASGQYVSIQLPSLTSYVVQAGVFTQKEAAKQESATLSALGIPNVQLFLDGKTYLFIGIASTLNDAKELGTKYEGDGVKFYAKELQIGGKDKDHLNEVEKELLEQLPILYEGIVNASTAGYLYGTIENETIQQVNSAVKEWRKINDQQLRDEQLIQLKKEFDTSISHLQEYNESRDSQKMIEVQQNLLNILSLYHKL